MRDNRICMTVFGRSQALSKALCGRPRCSRGDGMARVLGGARALSGALRGIGVTGRNTMSATASDVAGGRSRRRIACQRSPAAHGQRQRVAGHVGGHGGHCARQRFFLGDCRQVREAGRHRSRGVVCASGIEARPPSGARRRCQPPSKRGPPSGQGGRASKPCAWRSPVAQVVNQRVRPRCWQGGCVARRKPSSMGRPALAERRLARRWFSPVIKVGSSGAGELACWP